VTTRGCFSIPEVQTLLYPFVSCLSANDKNYRGGGVGKTPHSVSTLDVNCFMVYESRNLTSTVEL